MTPYEVVGNATCAGVAQAKDGTLYARFASPLPPDAPRGAEAATMSVVVTQQQAALLAVGKMYMICCVMWKWLENVEYKKGGSGMHDRYRFDLKKLEPAK